MTVAQVNVNAAESCAVAEGCAAAGGCEISASFFIPADDQGYSNAGERIFDWAVCGNLKILEMNRRKLSIEDIFVKLTSDENRSEANEKIYTV